MSQPEDEGHGAAGQRLMVTSGVGLTQEWDQPVQVIRPGDVVVPARH